MAVSTITQFADEYTVQALGSFDRSGTMYLAWTAVQGAGQALFWRQYTQGDGLEIEAAFQAGLTSISTIYRLANDAVVFAYDTDGGPGSPSSIYVVSFQLLTGAKLSGPTLVASGFRPRLMYRGGVVGDKMLLVYANRSTNTMYVRESEDGGTTWSGERPVVSNLIEGVASILGWPTFLNDAMPTTLGAGLNQDEVIACRPSDLVLFTGDPVMNVDRDVTSGTLSARVRLHVPTAAITNRYSSGIGVLQGTGLVVQTGF